MFDVVAVIDGADAAGTVLGGTTAPNSIDTFTIGADSDGTDQMDGGAWTYNVKAEK